jgi:glutathione S-transferase
MAAADVLALYHFPTCPFCASVRSAADALGLDLELRDIHATPEYAEELVDVMGKTTVPVLRIAESNGEIRWLAESVDIIEYLEERVV